MDHSAERPLLTDVEKVLFVRKSANQVMGVPCIPWVVNIMSTSA